MVIKSVSFWNPFKVKILYLHAPDHETPLLETLTAINDLYKEGKFEEFGLSNFSSWVSLLLANPGKLIQILFRSFFRSWARLFYWKTDLFSKFYFSKFSFWGLELENSSIRILWVPTWCTLFSFCKISGHEPDCIAGKLIRTMDTVVSRPLKY